MRFQLEGVEFMALNGGPAFKFTEAISLSVDCKSQEEVDDYLAALPEDQRAALGKLRETIKAAAPDAVESISYGIPTFKYKGRPLIHIGAAKHHCAIYGLVPDAFKDDLKRYDTSKGTIRFPADKPLPDTLVRKLIKVRIDEIEAGANHYAKRTSKTISRKDE